MRASSLIEQALTKNEWPLCDTGGLSVYMSPMLCEYKRLLHAFTTRLGGSSKPPKEHFNLSRNSDDAQAKADAASNQERLCKAIGLDFKRLVVPGQVHSNRVISSEARTLSEVDGVATSHVGRPLLLHFADCVPIIIYEPNSHCLAVVHAGWRGTAGCIAKNAVSFLSSELGCSAKHMVAAVGPAIGSCCYPTGDDVAQQLSQTISVTDPFIDRSQPNPRCDLKAINALQLYEAGVARVDVTSACTACQPELFYSHRQSGGKTGRQGAIAGLTAS